MPGSPPQGRLWRGRQCGRLVAGPVVVGADKGKRRTLQSRVNSCRGRSYCDCGPGCRRITLRAATATAASWLSPMRYLQGFNRSSLWHRDLLPLPQVCYKTGNLATAGTLFWRPASPAASKLCDSYKAAVPPKLLHSVWTNCATCGRPLPLLCTTASSRPPTAAIPSPPSPLPCALQTQTTPRPSSWLLLAH